MSTISVPGSPQMQYRQLRDAGHDHDEALGRVAHAYGRTPRELVDRLDRTREEWEAQQDAPAAEPEPVVEPQGETDPFAAVEAQITGRIATLTDERAGLSLDALDDPKKAAALKDVEDRLANARVELERLGVARLEAGRRKLAEQDAEAQQVREDALHRAAVLQADREKAAARIDRAARALADSLAAHQSIAAQQAQVLGVVGGYGLRQLLPPSWALGGALAFALAQASAPVPDFTLIRDPRPLAETDRRPVAAINPDQKGK